VSCTSYDWKSYALDELDAAGRREAEAHAANCSTCRDELAGLRLTLNALSTLREEEIPRRIGFVSDKVFEPRWWQSFWRPSFAAGCVVAAAILVHAFVRPAAPAAPAAVDMAQVESRIELEVARRVDAAVVKAVAQTEDRQAQKTQQLLAESEKRYAEQRKADFVTAARNYEMLNKQVLKMYAVNTGTGFGQ
jgi:hypothetical protein